ncbi:MAG: 50S ribosomal protein L23 [Verrucomicrobia bacterium CG_4_10_14_3_um_filter_43_23]|nr:MAG: 50S ribosomal protein L23 [Verrucomicrobia bacterium CG1_02_43_26]PIP59613.1 MAG: 50S ribosomal protein L23 [Verrucomicrobia bacterium CG22_combo_CG10-13_8_21_14_all_43_17]PIX58912.1 MAG: 50S ribosomal protein L23 [Verrucomicrobia bacterium CG_4_10_14_3_um_filter_43_23]PIY61688.1 MAG: 50S ribosomal protein L23 [Verrucomicrobia bacterium CG_4_10_14_0_8_um_filter_43_34]PJA44572.1 MAG: 50S ribosomal protein L23 [Verrucomicrobia bacterium CG_4_9_14_3_um_filter_43_20]
MAAPDTILKEIRVTEKTSVLSSELNKYTFEVFKGANRKQIADAVEAVFKVKVQDVNVMNQKGKRKSNRAKRGLIRKPDTRKAIVTLCEGSKIEIM